MIRIVLLITLSIMIETVSAQDTNISSNNIDTVNFKCGVSTLQYAGRIYHIVIINTQCWLKENLNVGTMISGSQEQSKKIGVIEKYCYNDDSTNCTTRGGLYQWDEAMQYNSESLQGICPGGWHIPSFNEFQTLESSVNFIGNALKEIGQGVGDGSGTNASGFSALLAGNRHSDGYFNDLGTYARFWSSTEGEPETAYMLRLTNAGSSVLLYDINKGFGYSVRCVKD